AGIVRLPNRVPLAVEPRGPQREALVAGIAPRAGHDESAVPCLAEIGRAALALARILAPLDLAGLGKAQHEGPVRPGRPRLGMRGHGEAAVACSHDGDRAAGVRDGDRPTPGQHAFRVDLEDPEARLVAVVAGGDAAAVARGRHRERAVAPGPARPAL